MNGLKSIDRKRAAGAELWPQLAASCALHHDNKLSQHTLFRQSGEKILKEICRIRTEKRRIRKKYAEYAEKYAENEQKYAEYAEEHADNTRNMHKIRNKYTNKYAEYEHPLFVRRIRR